MRDKKLYKQRRVEQLEAIKGFQKLNNYEKQYAMVSILSKNIFTVIASSKTILENGGYVPGISPFPDEEAYRDALSNILENTALFGEIVIRFPDISNTLLKTHSEWESLFKWSISFLDETKHLIDSSTLKLLDLVNQELNYTDRIPDYFNPYRIVTKSKSADRSSNHTEKKKVRKKYSRGPMLSRTEL